MKTLNELGDSFDPYPYQLEAKYFDGFTATFATPKEHYEARFSILDDGGVTKMRTSFIVMHKPGDQFTLNRWSATNEGLPTAFRVMATVVAAAEESMRKFHKKFPSMPIQTVTFSSSDEGKTGTSPSEKKTTQRIALYLAFIKKRFGGSVTVRKTRFNGDGDIKVEVDIPKGWYDRWTKKHK